NLVATAQRVGGGRDVLSGWQAPWGVPSAMGRLAAGAVVRSLLGDMSFSIGRREEPPLLERTVGLAFDGRRQLVGYVTWLWLPAAEMFVLDEVKRGPKAPAGTIEVLIGTSLLGIRGRARPARPGLAHLPR